MVCQGRSIHSCTAHRIRATRVALLRTVCDSFEYRRGANKSLTVIQVVLRFQIRLHVRTDFVRTFLSPPHIGTTCRINVFHRGYNLVIHQSRITQLISSSFRSYSSRIYIYKSSKSLPYFSFRRDDWTKNIICSKIPRDIIEQIWRRIRINCQRQCRGQRNVNYRTRARPRGREQKENLQTTWFSNLLFHFGYAQPGIILYPCNLYRHTHANPLQFRGCLS